MLKGYAEPNACLTLLILKQTSDASVLCRFTPVFKLKHIEEWSKTEKEKQMADVTIRATKNGPYLVRGPIELLDTTGNKIKVEKETIALCRCGGSTTKPFCDGTHSRIGFQAAEAAVEEADSK